MVVPRWIATTLTGLLLVLAGCGGGDSGSPASPPSGWSASETRMWNQSVDTSEVFRNMSSLSAMGLFDEEVTLSPGSINQEQFQKVIKRSLLELYRSNPTIVDSLFEEHALPVLQDAELGSDAVQGGELKKKILDKYKQQALKAIQDHYEQPILQQGITGLPLPDSLHTKENSGSVEVQVHVNENGEVDAVEILEGTHPTLNAIVMRAVAQTTTWNPAFVTENQSQAPHSGWGRIPANIPAPR